jgi:hypothetical protein
VPRPVHRIVVTLLLLLSFPRGSGAQSASRSGLVPQAIRLHLLSWHDRDGYDNANLGAALRWKGGLVVGGFNNSLGRMSWYGGLTVPAFQRRAIQLELMAGVITGYSDATPVDVVAVPTLGWRLTARNTLQVVFIPRFVVAANAVHVMFERRIGDLQ